MAGIRKNTVTIVSPRSQLYVIGTGNVLIIFELSCFYADV